MIPVAKPYFTEDEERAAAAVMRSGWVVQGPRVMEFERAVARPNRRAPCSRNLKLHDRASPRIGCSGNWSGRRSISPLVQFYCDGKQRVACGRDSRVRGY